MEMREWGQAPMTPNILVITPDPQLPAALMQALSGLDVRTTHQRLTPSARPIRLEGAPHALILFIDGVVGPSPEDLFSLFDDAAQIHCPIILSTTLDGVDCLQTELWSACHAVLVDPDMVDIAAAVAGALVIRPVHFSDVSRDLDADRLQRLADEVGRIARTLASLSAAAPLTDIGVSDAHPGYLVEPDRADQSLLAREIRAMLRMRRLRDRFFDSRLFADPAWDMLLDLTAARLERVQVAVSSLCIAACVPSTTALRWIKMMTEKGLFERVSDPVDGRRVYIRLSDGTALAMTRLLSAVRHAGAPLI